MARASAHGTVLCIIFSKQVLRYANWDVHTDCSCSLYLVLKRLTARWRLVSRCGAPEERAMPARLHTLCEGDTCRNRPVSLGCRGLRRTARHRCGACWRAALQALAGPRQIVLESTEPDADRHKFWFEVVADAFRAHCGRCTGTGSTSAVATSATGQVVQLYSWPVYRPWQPMTLTCFQWMPVTGCCHSGRVQCTRCNGCYPAPTASRYESSK
jgi:hypothetical protein